MKIGIIVAIKDEAEILAKALNLTLISSKEIYCIYTNSSKNIVMITPGNNDEYHSENGTPIGRPGKVSAGIVTTILIEKYKPDVIINAGTAAGVFSQGISIGEIVVGDTIANHDIHIPLHGYKEYGLRKILLQGIDIFNQIRIPYKIGTISSSESFITTKEGWEIIKVNNVSVIEMEAAGVLQAVEILQYQQPVFVIKAITGLENSESQDSQLTSDFVNNFTIAMNNLAGFLKEAIVIIQQKYQATFEKDMSIRFELFTSDIEKSVAFYRDILRFAEMPSNGNYQPMHRGDVHIGIGTGDTLPEGHYFRPEIVTNARKGIGIEFVLEVDDIEEEYIFIQSTNYPIKEKLKKQEWGLTDFRLVDPDEYYLRITSKI